jgi:hypothetical protein
MLIVDHSLSPCMILLDYIIHVFLKKRSHHRVLISYSHIHLLKMICSPNNNLSYIFCYLTCASYVLFPLKMYTFKNSFVHQKTGCVAMVRSRRTLSSSHHHRRCHSATSHAHRRHRNPGIIDL